MIKTLLFIGIGSFAGGISRYLLSRAIQTISNISFPLGTMAVNILGCLIIGILYGLLDRHSLSNQMWMLLTIGFCGSFTTFSTFIHENYTLFNDEKIFQALLYSALSFSLGFLALYLGKLIVVHAPLN